MAYLSRRTNRDVVVMLAVTDPSSMGLQTAKRIEEVAKVNIDFKNFYLVGNRFKPEMEPMFQDEVQKL